MKNTNLENLYNEMNEIFTNEKIYGNFISKIGEKYNNNGEFKLNEDDIDDIRLICRKDLSHHIYDKNNNLIINENEWNEFLNYTNNFIKNIIINK